MANKKSKAAKKDSQSESTGLAIAAGMGLALVTGVTALLFARRKSSVPKSGTVAATAEEHVPSDLLDKQANPEDRAPVAFRPDMSAPMSEAEREAMRPATIGAPPRDPETVEQS